jgi:prepilin-type N-terminal cleavage/methylation domain-containing protein
MCIWPNNPRRVRGYSLIEVLVVVAIIGIAGAVIVPQMLQAGSLNVQGAGRLVIADLLYAQNDAIAQQATRMVVFDTNNNRYRLTDATGATLTVNWKGGASSAGNYIVDFTGDSRFAGVKMTAASFGASNTNTVQFDALGSTKDGGTVDLVAGNFHYRISVAAITGRVNIAPVTGP